jgi:tRNA(Ile)-lysidine synthase
MARRGRLDGLILHRPLLEVPKARLIATCRAARLRYADDPSNVDPKFTRARLRGLMPALAKEGLDARRLAILARRLRRADAAIEAETTRAGLELAKPENHPPRIAIDALAFSKLPAEIALRLLGRVIGGIGSEGPVELGKLEALFAAAVAATQGTAPFRRTLAGALVAVQNGRMTVEKAPPRGKKPSKVEPLTKRGRGQPGRGKAR